MFQTAWKLVFLSFFLLCIAAEIQGQDVISNVTGYSCSDGPTSCSTYAFYKAQASMFLNLTAIGTLFGVSNLAITKASGLPDDTSSLAEGQSLLIPITCGCMGNYSQANIRYDSGLQGGDTFWKVSTEHFEYLTTYQALQVANPTIEPTNLLIGEIITIPIRCQCPSKAQISKGINMLITYVVQKADTLESIIEKFGANLEDLKSENGMPSILYSNTTLLVPVSVKPTLAQSPSPAPSPSSRTIVIMLRITVV